MSEREKKTLTVTLRHNAAIPGTRWCEPKGWMPLNKINGAEYIVSSWWAAEEEKAGLLWFGEINAYGPNETIEANLDDLRVASYGDCRVIGEVVVVED